MTISKPDLESTRLAAVRTAAVEAYRLAESLDQLATLTADICHAPTAIISLVDDAHQVFLASVGVNTDRVPREDTFCTHVIASGDVFVTGDARQVPMLSQKPAVIAKGGIRSYVGAPIKTQAGLAIGTVCIVSPEIEAFNAADVRRLEQITELVASGFQRIEAEAKAMLAEAIASAATAERAHYELALHAIAEGVHFYDSSGVIIDVNESAEQMFLIPRQESIGVSYRDPAWIVRRPDGSLCPAEEFPVHQALTTGRTIRDVIMGVERADGKLCWIATNAAPIRDDPDGPVSFVAVTFRDVTELLHNEARLREALVEAERANQAKSDFLGVMSHELRTPMNAILGCAHILDGPNLTPIQQDSLQVLGAAGQQMVAVLDDLFEMIAFDTGKVRIETTEVVPGQIIETVAATFRAQAAAKGIALVVTPGEGLETVRRLDPNRVRQILGNLLANALKFTERGHVVVSARISCNSVGRDILALDVEDTGIGIAPEAVERIFSPFEQADVSTKRRHGGIGVGLAVVRRLALAMGGDATVVSEQGKGSRFRVHIEAPLCADVRLPPADEPAAPAEFVPKSVLLVDDNPRNLFVLSTILSGAGHDVTTADSGGSALQLLRERAFDIVLLDMVMPEVDGFDVMREARQAGRNLQTPIVACTANVLPQQVTAYRQAGAAGVLPKPIDVAEVLSMIATAAR